MKSHTRFRLVPKSKTLHDLKDHYALCFKIHAISEPTTKIWMNTDQHYQRQRRGANCPMTVYSFWQYKVYADICCGSLERRRQTRVELSKRQFSVLSLAISLEALEVRPTLLYSRLSTDAIIRDLEWLPNGHFTLNSVFVNSSWKSAYLLIWTAPLYLWKEKALTSMPAVSL